MRTRIWHSDWKPRWLIRCVSAALLSFMDKQVLQRVRFAAFGRGQGGNAGRPPGLRSARTASAGGDRAPGACQVLRALRDGDAGGVPRRGVGAGAVRPSHCRGGGLPSARPLPAGGSAVAGDGRALRRAGDGCNAGDHEREGCRAAAGRGLAHTGPGGGHGAGETHGRDRVPDRRAIPPSGSCTSRRWDVPIAWPGCAIESCPLGCRDP